MRPSGRVPARPGIEPIRPAGQVGGYDCSAGVAGRSLPPDNLYFLTTFGGGSDTQNVACAGMPPADGSWYYAADRSRFGCGSRILISNPANGRSVVAIVADYGPNRCVEQAAGMPVIDASPLVSRHLFGTDSSGYSQHRLVSATVVDPSTPLGPTTSSSAGVIALVLAGMTAAAIWYLEALPKPKRNPTEFKNVQLKPGHVLIETNSHRAREKLERYVLGYSPRQFYAFGVNKAWAEVPEKKLPEILRIKGIKLSKGHPDMRVTWSEK